jgi:hypothetical protein
MPLQLFLPGEIVVTNDARAALSDAGEDVQTLVDRHTSGDWGCVSQREAAQNEYGLLYGQHIVSFYRLRNGYYVGVITAPNRSSTTLLAPAVPAHEVGFTPNTTAGASGKEGAL